MKWYLCFLFLCVGSVVADEELPLADICDPENCLLPDCRCSSTSIPGDLEPRDTPQFVLLTFDDAVSITNIPTYRRLLDGRRNVNNCPAGATFFISHEYTNYQLVNELYNKGHEIALHSITHRTPQTFWQEATTEDMRREIGDQKQQMSHFANIPMNAIRGVRMPFLQMTGNATFEVMAEFGLDYDLSWPTITHINPGMWPYTLDYASTQDCVTAPCPSASIPGVWVLPMITWRDLDGNACGMVDSCFPAYTPPHDDEEGWFRFIVQNFERHYFGNRAPFGFYVHEWFISINPAIERALVRFMDMVNNLHDAYMVTGQEVIDWVKDPVPVNEYNAKPCKWLQASPCPASNCGPLPATHNEQNMWIGICNACPRTYPWVNNPLGL